MNDLKFLFRDPQQQRLCKLNIKQFLINLFEEAGRRVIDGSALENEKKIIQDQCAEHFAHTIPEDFINSSDLLSGCVTQIRYYCDHSIRESSYPDRIYRSVMTDVSLARARGSWMSTNIAEDQDG